MIICFAFVLSPVSTGLVMSVALQSCIMGSICLAYNKTFLLYSSFSQVMVSFRKYIQEDWTIMEVMWR